MSRIPSGILVWDLYRYTRDGNLWDRVCEQCKQRTPVFEYEHGDEDEGLLFGYLCDVERRLFLPVLSITDRVPG